MLWILGKLTVVILVMPIPPANKVASQHVRVKKGGGGGINGERIEPPQWLYLLLVYQDRHIFVALDIPRHALIGFTKCKAAVIVLYAFIWFQS